MSRASVLFNSGRRW